MSNRKQISAEKRKEALKKVAFAKLNRYMGSPRKARLVADLVRGMDVEYALHVLKHTPNKTAEPIYKLLLSAMANWEAKNEGKRIDETSLYIKEIFVNGGRMLKRIQPAPQGRAHRIRKRSSHITLIVDEKE
jgi:large subunit ribosomal protein L22